MDYYTTLLILWEIVGAAALCCVMYDDTGDLGLGDLIICILGGTVGPLVFVVHLCNRITLI